MINIVRNSWATCGIRFLDACYNFKWPLGCLLDIIPLWELHLSTFSIEYAWTSRINQNGFFRCSRAFCRSPCLRGRTKHCSLRSQRRQHKYLNNFRTRRCCSLHCVQSTAFEQIRRSAVDGIVIYAILLLVLFEYNGRQLCTRMETSPALQHLAFYLLLLCWTVYITRNIIRKFHLVQCLVANPC